MKYVQEQRFSIAATFIGVAFAFLVFVGGAPVAHAHIGGTYWELPDGAYTVDIGYDPAVFVAGEFALFDFLLWKGTVNTGTKADYEHVWVRILGPSGDTILATGVMQQNIGPTTMLYAFPERGTYRLEVSYRDSEGNDIARAETPILVGASSDAQHPATENILSSGISLVIGVIFGAGGLSVYLRRRGRA